MAGGFAQSPCGLSLPEGTGDDPQDSYGWPLSGCRVSFGSAWQTSSPTCLQKSKKVEQMQQALERCSHCPRGRFSTHLIT